MSDKKKILLLDDSPLVLQVARDALQAAGYEVTVANDLKEFEDQRDAADLLLIDVQMPEAFGDDVAGMLRGARGVKKPIYLFSMLDEADLAVRAEEAEIDGYISKRAGVEALIERVQNIFAESEPHG